MRHIFMVLVLGLGLLASCAGSDGKSCTVSSSGDDMVVITCASGSEVLKQGRDGVQGPAGPAGPEGSVGPAGPAGLAALIETAPESPGANCAHGGTKITSGVDANRDGSLSPDEVSQTRFVCGAASVGTGTLEGTVNIENSDDVARYLAYTEIDGWLNIDARFMSQVSLSQLQFATSIQMASGNPTARIELGALVETSLVGGGGLGAAAEISMPNLVRVRAIDDARFGSTGTLDISSYYLTTLNLSALRFVDAGLRIDATSLTSLDLSSLERVDGNLRITVPSIPCEDLDDICSRVYVVGTCLVTCQQ